MGGSLYICFYCAMCPSGPSRTGLPKPQAGLDQQSATPDQTTHVPLHCSVGTLTYGLDALTLDTRIDGLYFRLHRRVLRMKVSSYSRVSNQTVWVPASKPIASYCTCTKTCCATVQAEDPLHHVFFRPALRDRKRSTGAKRGRLTKYWLHETETKLLSALLHLNPFS